MTHVSYMKRDLKNDRLAKLVKEKNLEPKPTNLEAIPLQNESYERLEFLGDSVIHLILAEYLYDRYSDEQEGFMTKLRTKIENGQVLSNFSKILGLHNYVLIARNIEQIGGREKNLNILEDAFEAFIGSLFLESTFETCRKLVVTLMETAIDMSSLIHVETNFKDMLLQHYHKMRWPDPEYSNIHTVENNNKKIFQMIVKGFTQNSEGTREWVTVGEGAGSSKKKGEQEAAKDALVRFGVIRENEDDEAYEEIYDDPKMLSYN